ncbi:MAG: hypothetical protein WBP81_29090 [Solirubrobacteraceae bacterium]
MDARSEIREFLTSRRAKLKAADVGRPTTAPVACPACAAKKLPYWPA